jgi:tellurite resistance protein TerC
MHVLAIWGLFAGLIIGLLMVDILRQMKDPRPMSLREAAVWTSTWVGLAALFGAAIFAVYGTDKGLEFTTGYLIEWSLSVDNLFVFLMIFQYFRVPATYQQRVLFWGIIGAIVLRGVFIFGAVNLLSYFAWLVYVFGAFLIYVGIKLLRQGSVHVKPQKNPILSFFKRFVPVETSFDSPKFFVRRNGKLVATALMPVMIVVATTDIMFAVDSIPAILAITRDPFIVYTSNLYAILGLRALFFLLAGIMGMFRFLPVGLCAVLIFVGVKMSVSEFIHIPIGISLGVVITVLIGSIVVSLLFPVAKDPVFESGDKSLALAVATASVEEDTAEAGRKDRAA